MQIGDWELTSLLAGVFRLDGGAMFGVVPKKIWVKLAPADEDNRILMVMRLLLIRGKGRTILVDSGPGAGYRDKVSRIYAFENTSPMADLLKVQGITPDDVTDVILTHLHFDHGGGVATPDGNGWTLTFPNAVHHVQKKQWEHALSPNPRDRASYFRERIEIMGEGNALALHDGEWTLDAGVDVIAFQGHTPGQQLPKVSGDGQTVFYCGDLVPMRHHLPTPYVMSYDLDPVLAMQEKELVLRDAADGGWVLFLEHDPDVAACTVLEEDGRYVAAKTVEI